MSINAKEIIKSKFWILEDQGKNIGTVSFSDDKYLISDTSGSRFFKNTTEIEKKFGKKLHWTKLEITVVISNEVYGWPTSCPPNNPVLDVKKKLPLFTKSKKSKSLYCAGYYIIRFDKGWVKSFCPKLLTIERYESQGPFKTDIEMKQALSKANGSN